MTKTDLAPFPKTVRRFLSHPNRLALIRAAQIEHPRGYRIDLAPDWSYGGKPFLIAPDTLELMGCWREIRRVNGAIATPFTGINLPGNYNRLPAPNGV